MMHISRKSLMFAMIFISICMCGCFGKTSSKEQKESENFRENMETGSVGEDFIIPYDPERQIYFTCQNIDTDIYLYNSMVQTQSFCILSLQYINPEEIKVLLPIQSSYSVIVEEFQETEIRVTDYLLNKDNENAIISNPCAFPYYLYQSYKGTDWKKMYQLYDEANKATKTMKELEEVARNNGTSEQLETDEAYLEQKEIVNCFNAYKEEYLEGYQGLDAEDLPNLYVYNIVISFFEGETSSTSECFNTIEIQIGDVTYRQDIGEIRLHVEEFPTEIVSSWAEQENIESLFGVPTGMDYYPWGDGVACKTVQYFKAKEDITITDLYLYESDIEILGARVITSKSSLDGSGSSSGNGVGADFYWDLESELAIEKGTYVKIDLIFQDVRLAKLEYGGRLYPVMVYKKGDDIYYCHTELSLNRAGYVDLWLRYALVFDGLDMESYFQDYYRPIYENWREGIL